MATQFNEKTFDDLLTACADANYDCGAFMKGITDEPFPKLVERACKAGQALRDYVLATQGADHDCPAV